MSSPESKNHLTARLALIATTLALPVLASCSQVESNGTTRSQDRQETTQNPEVLETKQFLSPNGRYTATLERMHDVTIVSLTDNSATENSTKIIGSLRDGVSPYTLEWASNSEKFWVFMPGSIFSDAYYPGEVFTSSTA